MEYKKDIKATYDFCRSLVSNILKKIESDKDYKPTEKELEVISSSFNEVILFIRTYLIMAYDVLYGSILMTMETSIDYSVRSVVDLRYKNSNFSLVFNPMFISPYDKITSFISIIIAEILRLIYEHPSAFASLNNLRDTKSHEILEDSSNAAVSTLIEKDIRLSREENGRRNLSLPDDFYTVSDVIAETDMKAKDRASIEYYYEMLRKFRKRNSQNSFSNKNKKNSSSDFGSAASGSGGQPGDNTGSAMPGSGGQPGDSTESGNDGNGVAAPNNDKGIQPHDWENQNSEKMSADTKEMIRSVYENLPSQSRGLIPGSILAQIQLLLTTPEINWKELLKKFIGTVPVSHRASNKRRNRLQPFRCDLRGRLPKRKVNIVICIDTSGSMSNETIEYCMNEVFNIIKANETKVTIIECDAEVGRVYEAKKPSDVKPDVSGRGGTSFTPAIEYINKEGKFKDALMIYFTDGYGDFEIPKPMTHRNLWVVTERAENLSVKNPYGEVKSLKMDGDYTKFMNRKRGF